MSPANDYFKDKPLLAMFITLSIGLITVFTANALTKKDIDAREFKLEIENKATIEQLNEVKIKAKEYTDSQFNNHEAKEQLEFANVKLMINETKSQNEKILEGLNRVIELSERRITRLEDKVY